jgi:UDP-sulfoquinovose synthase
MRILVLGGDGYCGWPTALYLSNRGHEVAIVDSFVRRSWDHELGAQSLTQILPLTDRLRIWHRLTGKEIASFVGNILDYEFLAEIMQGFAPEAVVHFAEQRSDRPRTR